MMSTKIINILKDDTFPEILELFRQSQASEVIFVLPKKSAVFRREDHFAAFASEAAGTGKTISILCGNADVNTLARKYKFTVMSATKPVRQKAKKPPTATATSSPLPSDDDIDPNEDAFQNDVTVPSDETMGLHVSGGDDETGRFDDTSIEDEENADSSGLDYIDAVWRQKAADAAHTTTAPTLAAAIRTGRLPERSFISRSVAAVILAVAVAMLAAIIYMTTGSATIAITPVARPLDTRITVQASDVFSAVDANFGKIPGQLFRVSKTASVQASATGSREVASKARGTLTVTNAFSSAPQTLIATTRFESRDGLIFRTLQTVQIPGSTVENGAPVPGTTTVPVIADKPGAGYNIGPGAFTIPAFKERSDTDRYAKVTAASVEAFTGGANGPSAVVTQSDVDGVRTAAIEAVKSQIAQAFSVQASGLMILDSSAPVGDVKMSAKPDDAAANVTATATGTLSTIAFRKEDLEWLISQTILKKERLTVIPEKLELAFSGVSFRPDTGVLTFTVSAEGTGYVPIATGDIIRDITGKRLEQIQEYFRGREGVASATVTLSPFWVRSVPKSPARTTITATYETVMPDAPAEDKTHR